MLIISPSCSADESLAPDNSRLPVAAAYRQIAKKYAISEEDVKSEIVQALLGGRLHVRNQAGFPSCPDVLDLTVECITFDDLNEYFASQGYRYRLYRPDFDDLISGDAEGGTPLTRSTTSDKAPDFRQPANAVGNPSQSVV